MADSETEISGQHGMHTDIKLARCMANSLWHIIHNLAKSIKAENINQS